MKIEILEISGDSPGDLQERVYRLRHRIYIEEMHLPLRSDHGLLKDPFDRHSTSLLATSGGRDVGTLRITSRAPGPLELWEQSEAWRARTLGPEYLAEGACELTRFMVVPELRGGRSQGGGLIGLCLFAHMFRHCTRRGIRWVFAAAKHGSLMRHYGSHGAQPVGWETAEYRVDGHVLGTYSLCCVDFGRPRSLRRLRWEAEFRLVCLSARATPRLYWLLSGRRRVHAEPESVARPRVPHLAAMVAPGSDDPGATVLRSQGEPRSAQGARRRAGTWPRSQ